MYEYMILMMPKNNQISMASRLIQDQAFAFQDIQGSGNRLPDSVIDCQKTILKKQLLEGF